MPARVQTPVVLKPVRKQSFGLKPPLCPKPLFSPPLPSSSISASSSTLDARSALFGAFLSAIAPNTEAYLLTHPYIHRCRYEPALAFDLQLSAGNQYATNSGLHVATWQPENVGLLDAGDAGPGKRTMRLPVHPKIKRQATTFLGVSLGQGCSVLALRRLKCACVSRR